jgi:hypothetical protein
VRGLSQWGWGFSLEVGCCTSAGACWGIMVNIITRRSSRFLVPGSRGPLERRINCIRMDQLLQHAPPRATQLTDLVGRSLPMVAQHSLGFVVCSAVLAAPLQGLEHVITLPCRVGVARHLTTMVCHVVPCCLQCYW